MEGKLRPGSVDSAKYWDEVLPPKIDRQQEVGKEMMFAGRCRVCQTEDLQRWKTRGEVPTRLPSNAGL